MNLLWCNDPKDGKPSVSLTLLVLTFLGCLIAGSLQISGKTETASIFLELFYGASALYFGRRWSAGTKTLDTNNSNS